MSDEPKTDKLDQRRLSYATGCLLSILCGIAGVALGWYLGAHYRVELHAQIQAQATEVSRARGRTVDELDLILKPFALVGSFWGEADRRLLGQTPLLRQSPHHHKIWGKRVIALEASVAHGKSIDAASVKDCIAAYHAAQVLLANMATESALRSHIATLYARGAGPEQLAAAVDEVHRFNVTRLNIPGVLWGGPPTTFKASPPRTTAEATVAKERLQTIEPDESPLAGKKLGESLRGNINSLDHSMIILDRDVTKDKLKEAIF
jgi:hypothetical protein